MFSLHHCIATNVDRIEKGIKGMIEWVTAAPNAYVAIIGDGPMAPELIALHGKKNRVYCVPGACTIVFIFVACLPRFNVGCSFETRHETCIS
jgi:hypothetical protein